MAGVKHNELTDEQRAAIFTRGVSIALSAGAGMASSQNGDNTVARRGCGPRHTAAS